MTVREQAAKVHKHPVAAGPVAVYSAGRVGVPAVLVLQDVEEKVRVALVEMFGLFPMRITTESYDMLCAMAAADPGNRRVYEMLADAVQKYGRIDLRDA
jgi:hypothetical protein